MTETETSKNYEFYINAELDDYAGKWVGIIDEKVVAIGDRADEVIKEIKKKYPNEKFLLSKVPEPGLLVLGGGT